MSVKNSVFYNVLLAISQVFFPLITFPYLARTLGPEHVGVLNFAESIAKYFVMLAALGIPIYGIREIAKVQNELASVALEQKENRPLLGWLLLIPVLTGLVWACLSLPRPPAIGLAVPAAGLTGLYILLRWKMADAYSDRLIAQLQLSVGWWGTLYGMLGLAAVCVVMLTRIRGGWEDSRVTML